MLGELLTLLRMLRTISLHLIAGMLGKLIGQLSLASLFSHDFLLFSLMQLCDTWTTHQTLWKPGRQTQFNTFGHNYTVFQKKERHQTHGRNSVIS